jgi:hypothetical protein
VETNGLAATSDGARVVVAAGVVSVEDGPFDDTAGAYTLFEVSSKEEVVDWVSRFMRVHRDNWPGWEGVSEIRRVLGPEDFG